MIICREKQTKVFIIFHISRIKEILNLPNTTQTLQTKLVATPSSYNATHLADFEKRVRHILHPLQKTSSFSSLPKSAYFSIGPSLPHFYIVYIYCCTSSCLDLIAEILLARR